jgi:type 1 glutamine amidotransferase
MEKDETIGSAVILSGSGRFADPWHPFAETSECIAEILREAGFTVTVDERVDERMTDLSGIDLLVVNVGAPDEVDPALDGPARAGLLAYLEQGGPILSMHVSSTSFPGIPEWEAIEGGIWVRGETMHPDLDSARIQVFPERHAIVSRLHDFAVDDERYSYLRTAPDVAPLASHVHDGIEHPLLWARRYGTSRVVYDALGHDRRSFDSPEHREIVSRAALWLVGGPLDAPEHPPTS